MAIPLSYTPTSIVKLIVEIIEPYHGRILWFFDKGKAGTGRADKVLFLDARHVFRQLDRAHCDFTRAQLEFLANVVRFYRGEDLELNDGSEEKWPG